MDIQVSKYKRYITWMWKATSVNEYIGGLTPHNICMVLFDNMKEARNLGVTLFLSKMSFLKIIELSWK